MITREEVALAIHTAISEVDESAYNHLDEGDFTLSADFYLDGRELADKLKPLFAKIWQAGADAEHQYQRAEWEQIYSLTNDQAPDPLRNPYE